MAGVGSYRGVGDSDFCFMPGVLAMSTHAQIRSWEQTCLTLGPRQLEVMECLAVNHPGLTAWELAARLGRMIHALRPRITELRKKGLVIENGERWHEQTQRHEAVWVVAKSGQLDLL